MVHTNLRCDCWCTVAERPQSTHKTHTYIITKHAVVHTRKVAVSVAVSSSKQSKKNQKAEMWGSSTQTRPHLHTCTRIIAHTEHPYNVVTAYAGGNMEHGLLHATHSSCWCCCYGSALLPAETEMLLLHLLLCPRQAWS